MFRVHKRQGEVRLEAFLGGRWTVIPADTRPYLMELSAEVQEGETLDIGHAVGLQAVRDACDQARQRLESAIDLLEGLQKLEELLECGEAKAPRACA